MPTVFRDGAFRFFFYSNEGLPLEPLHIHVRARGKEAKIWLEPEAAIANSHGFSPRELGAILKIAIARQEDIREAWYDHFGD
ncbi:DUF4160 domain-containing protein [Afifella sp. JA880]|uniref:DUF4160 domain-containing protein n=1 Tax=Afifella sp. JA880 TaxID=2975280 RepID=UPI0021BA7A0E|nr:DUF4160 domain-containing protein [Afifella sp. JA880]MCT8266926.1 DUF4160 domain-containing protein [Afifella sp. JA880]